MKLASRKQNLMLQDQKVQCPSVSSSMSTIFTLYSTPTILGRDFQECQVRSDGRGCICAYRHCVGVNRCAACICSVRLGMSLANGRQSVWEVLLVPCSVY